MPAVREGTASNVIGGDDAESLLLWRQGSVACGEVEAAAWTWWLGGGYEAARPRASWPPTRLSVSPLRAAFTREGTTSHQQGA